MYTTPNNAPVSRAEQLPLRHLQQGDRMLCLEEEDQQGGNQRSHREGEKRAAKHAYLAAQLAVDRGLHA